MAEQASSQQMLYRSSTLEKCFKLMRAALALLFVAVLCCAMHCSARHCFASLCVAIGVACLCYVVVLLSFVRIDGGWNVDGE